MSKTKVSKPVSRGAQELREYMNSMDKQTQIEFAALCRPKGKSTTRGQLRLICCGSRTCSPELAVEIDRVTGGRIRMEHLCPDAIDWEYVRWAMRDPGRQAVETATTTENNAENTSPGGT